MDRTQLAMNLPTLRQQLAVLALALLGAIWVFLLARQRKVREEHALLWFLGLGTVAVVVWCDPILLGVSALLGVEVPASALLLLAVFFLFVMAVRLTSEVSSQKAQIARLSLLVSIMRAELNGDVSDRRE